MGDITTLEIVLARVLTEDGHMAVKIQIPDRYNAVEVLGLLEAAKLHIYSEIQGFH